jgi:hypothetical protein
MIDSSFQGFLLNRCEAVRDSNLPSHFTLHTSHLALGTADGALTNFVWQVKASPFHSGKHA